MFKVIIEERVKKDLKNINKDDLKRIFNSIQALESNPLPQGVKKIKQGSAPYYRIRQGNFRIGYRYDTTQKLIEIIFIRRRNERTYDH